LYTIREGLLIKGRRHWREGHHSGEKSTKVELTADKDRLLF